MNFSLTNCVESRKHSVLSIYKGIGGENYFLIG